MVQEHSPSLVHFCYSCQSTSSVPFSASVFSQNHACYHCGYISTGLRTIPSNLGHRQQNSTQERMMQQEDLAALFNQRLNISNFSPDAQPSAAVDLAASQPQAEQGQPQQQRQQLKFPEEENTQKIVGPQPIIYASTHYTHTSHVPRASSEPTSITTNSICPTAAIASNAYSSNDSETFHRNSIDPSALSSGQISLFRAASPDQQLRLLELWRITLPAAAEDGVWTNATSLEQEEMLARERYDRMIEGRRVGRALGQMLPHPFAAPRQQQQQQQQNFQELWEQRGASSHQVQNQNLAFGHEAPHYQHQQQQWQAGAGDMDITDDDGTSASIMSSPRSIASPLPVQAQNNYNSSAGVGTNMPHPGVQYQQFPSTSGAHVMQQQQHAAHSNAEPYMLSGYEMLSKCEHDEGLAAKGLYTQSTDPVYKAAVENQYGAFQAVREYDGEMGWFDEQMAM